MCVKIINFVIKHITLTIKFFTVWGSLSRTDDSKWPFIFTTVFLTNGKEKSSRLQSFNAFLSKMSFTNSQMLI